MGCSYKSIVPPNSCCNAMLNLDQHLPIDKTLKQVQGDLTRQYQINISSGFTPIKKVLEIQGL